MDYIASLFLCLGQVVWSWVDITRIDSGTHSRIHQCTGKLSPFTVFWRSSSAVRPNATTYGTVFISYALIPEPDRCLIYPVLLSAYKIKASHLDAHKPLLKRTIVAKIKMKPYLFNWQGNANETVRVRMINIELVNYPIRSIVVAN